ncbi:MAG: DUF3524 domain-containing protein, partial [Phycisphaerae bacterium]|nr:DUF3524 domain-containing protein [Phycisphaerae bacterium]
MSRAQLNILAVEPYFGGLRRDFLEGLCAHSRHKWTLLTLPARNRPWRIRASALHFAQQMRGLRRRFDLLFVTDLLNLADLLALSPPRIRQLPAVAYFHENSLPRLRAGIREPGAGIMNITTALAARQAWFN